MNMSGRVLALCLCELLSISVVRTVITHPRTGEKISHPVATVTPGWKFDFGPGAVAAGYKQVMPQNIYSREAGFGFEPGAQINCVSRKAGDALRGDFCTSDTPFFFSVALPEGNYNVTVTLGDA